MLPLQLDENSSGGWDAGLGDVAVAVKRAIYHDAGAGRIFSLTGEVVLPTGDKERGFGKGTTVFEPFFAFGEIFRDGSFLQAQGGLELPFDASDDEAFLRAAYGKTFVPRRFGRAWTPMVELTGARELLDGSRAEWDIVPQLQVSLSKRQHILVSGGVRIPLNDRGERHAQVLTYLLWDWFDGGLRDGWR